MSKVISEFFLNTVITLNIQEATSKPRNCDSMNNKHVNEDYNYKHTIIFKQF